MDEVLFAYIVVASHAISLVLVRVDSRVQRPVYYVSKSQHEAEIRCLPLEKAILAVKIVPTYPRDLSSKGFLGLRYSYILPLLLGYSGRDLREIRERQ